MRSRASWTICALTMAFGIPLVGRAALIPPSYLDAVVAIGFSSPSPTSGVNGQQSIVPNVWFTEGTGFFYGDFIGENKSSGQKFYNIYLVTAAHVIKDHPSNLALAIRVNSKDPLKAPEFTLPLKPPPGQAKWLFGPDGSDVAAELVDVPSLTTAGIPLNFFRSDENAADVSRMRTLGVSDGDDIFVLGFPMNLAGKERNYVIVRRGIVAQDGDLLDGASSTYLIDAFVFPGNSGGPVVLRPDIVSITGTPSQNNAFLIGLVVSYTPYSDIAVSQQTHLPRIVFQENSGLATVVPIDALETLIHPSATPLAGSPVLPDQTLPQQPAR